MYHGDVALGQTIDLKFTTRSFSTGAPTTLSGTPVVSAYVGNGTTEITAGITLTVDFDARTGLNNVRVVASSGNGFATATDVELVITTGTVGGVSVVGEVIGSFSIENRSALRPSTAGRTLDVSTGGEAGVDWANVGGQSTSVNLSATTVNLVNTATTVTNTVSADAVAISGDSVAADALETMLDGTGGNTLSVGRLAIVAASPSPALDISNTTGKAVSISLGGSAVGPAVDVTTASGHYAVRVTGNGATSALRLVGGATGPAVEIVGGGTSGAGVSITTTSGAGISVAPAAGNALTLSGPVSLTSTLSVTGAFTATNAGNDIRGILLQSAQTFNMTGDITGNLSGSVGSVTGAVGSVTGNVGGNVVGSVGSVVGAVASVTGNVGGNVTGSVGSVATGGISRETFAADTGLQTIRSNTAQAGASTSITLDASASATDNFYNGCLVYLTGGTGAGQTREVLDYVGSTKVATVRAWVTNPDATTTFAVTPAYSVWDSVTADHLTSGSTGASLNAAGSAGDPWGTALPGAYGAGTAGFIVGTNLDAAVSSRAPSSTALSTAQWTNTLATNLGTTNTTVAANLDAAVSSRMATYTQPTGFLAATFPSGTITNNTTTPTWYTAPSTPPTTAQIATAVWTDLLASSDFSTVASIGKLLADNVDAAISSRMATFTLPTNFSSLAVTAGGAVTVGTNNDKTGYSLSGTQTFNLTGNITGNLSGTVGSVSDPASIWNFVTEGSVTAVQVMRGVASFVMGKATGGETTTITFRDLGDTKDRIAMTATSVGNRTAVTRDLT